MWLLPPLRHQPWFTASAQGTPSNNYYGHHRLRWERWEENFIQKRYLGDWKMESGANTSIITVTILVENYGILVSQQNWICFQALASWGVNIDNHDDHDNHSLHFHHHYESGVYKDCFKQHVISSSSSLSSPSSSRSLSSSSRSS